MEELSGAEALAALRAKEAELAALKQQVEAKRISAWDVGSISFDHAKGIGMWVPVVLAAWVWGYLSTTDCIIGLLCLLGVCFFTIFVDCYDFTRKKMLSEHASAMAVAAQRSKPATTPRSAQKKVVERETASAEEEAVFDPGQITIKTWLPPFLILWFFRHNFSDLEMVLAVLALIGALKLGQFLVRRFEKTKWRQALRARAKSAAEKEAKKKEKEAKKKQK